ncbi:hypothetical protein AAG570_007577 [Ranatra chinensis]|uniref:Uncharacterized protein n=1 Tax=Ranatra chinensis TaxID=642074 RepID=A0ABD0Y998_9HEMI
MEVNATAATRRERRRDTNRRECDGSDSASSSASERSSSTCTSGSEGAAAKGQQRGGGRTLRWRPSEDVFVGEGASICIGSMPGGEEQPTIVKVRRCYRSSSARDMVDKFNDIKQVLMHAPVLRYPDFTRQYPMGRDTKSGQDCDGRY